MAETTAMRIAEIESLAMRALAACGANDLQAAALARAVAAAECDGIKSHGLVYVPTYCLHLQCGKVNGKAIPAVAKKSPTVFVADAACGFAHAAIAQGFAELIPAAKEFGVASLAVRNSYNCGILGYHTEQLASAELVGLGFTNAPASIAPWGGSRAIVGTNPFSLASPDGGGGVAFVIDQSASVVAKSEVMMRARENKLLSEGWALDSEGKPTTNPDLALKGTMSPAGGYKGFGAGLMTEVFAAALAGATLGIDASPFSGDKGGPPRTGQFFIAFNPQIFGGQFGESIQKIIGAIELQKGARIPGSRRFANRKKAESEGVNINADIINKVEALIQ